MASTWPLRMQHAQQAQAQAHIAAHNRMGAPGVVLRSPASSVGSSQKPWPALNAHSLLAGARCALRSICEAGGLADWRVRAQAQLM